MRRQEDRTPLYFNHFRVSIDVIDLEVIGLGDHTLSLVQRTCELMQEDDYTQVWCVFDRDSFPAERFNEALNQASQHSINVAYSNEAFELWYLLHFHYYDTAIAREHYEPMLTKLLGRPYTKNDPDMYDRLETRQPDAIRHAQKLLESYGDHPRPVDDNPCTTVHLLVQKLNQLVR